MNYDEIFAKYDLVLVQAADVRRMMDYYVKANHIDKNDYNDECYTRLWNALHAVGLDRV